MSGGESYSWIGGTSGTWDDLANWHDLTAATVASSIPGVGSATTISAGVTLFGTGSAAGTTFLGNDTISGHLNTGTLLADGALAIGPGAILSGSGLMTGSVADNGLIITTGNLTLGQPIITTGGHGTSSYSIPEFTGTLSGTGTIEARPSAIVVLQDPVTSAGLTLQLDGNATLDIEASIGAGNTIDLLGTGNVLTIDDQWYLQEHPASIFGGDPYFTGSPPAVDAVVNGFNATDTIVFVDDFQLGTTITSAVVTSGTLSLWAGTSIVSTVPLGNAPPTDAFTVDPAIESTAFSPDTEQAIVPCFATGTRIATLRGAIPVERLKAGDRVATASGRTEEIQWIGRRTIDCLRHADPDRVQPIRVAPHAFGVGRPARALLLSPDHAIFTDEVLIPIRFLLNGATVAQVRVSTVTYYHLELARHDIVLAEGLPCESYLETGGRSAFENGGGLIQLHPDFARLDTKQVGMVWQNFAYAPLCGTDGQIDRVRARLAWQALMLGYQADGTPPKRRKGA